MALAERLPVKRRSGSRSSSQSSVETEVCRIIIDLDVSLAVLEARRLKDGDSNCNNVMKKHCGHLLAGHLLLARDVKRNLENWISVVETSLANDFRFIFCGFRKKIT